MNIKTLSAALTVAAVAFAAPQVASAGGELQSYERPYTGYSSTSYSAGTYAAPMPANYARPMGQYYGGNGMCGGPCATMPYGYSYGRPGGFGVGSDVFTAGLLGIGLGYLIFH